MFTAPASTIISILEGDELASSYADNHRHARDFYIKNRSAIPKHQHILEALEVISEKMEIILTVEQLETILSLFPETRIKLAVYEGCSDTEVEDLVVDSVYRFITGCESPIHNDNTDINRSFEYLHSQAKEMGYSLTRQVKL